METNAAGILGFAPKVKLLILKVLDKNGSTLYPTNKGLQSLSIHREFGLRFFLRHLHCMELNENLP
ncbi:hypothetical protein J7E66_31110 [Bacillus sp. ISL-7]|nr:hypothetical protein [Bacillus sp. ISL-7]